MKRTIIIATAVSMILIGGTAWGSYKINKTYPQRGETTAEKGNSLEFQDGVQISVKDSRMLPEEERKQVNQKAEAYAEYSDQIMEVTVQLDNQTEETKEVSLENVYLETAGMANGTSSFYNEAAGYGALNQSLEPGESKEVTYIYNLSKEWFQKREWKKIDSRQFWLTFSSYPEMTVLYL